MLLGLATVAEATPLIKGWGQFRYTWGTGSDTFLPANARVSFKQVINDRWRMQFLPDLSLSGGGVILLDAFVEYDLDKDITLMLGQFKYPFGLNRQYGPQELFFMANNLVGSGFGFGTWDQGLQIERRMGQANLKAVLINGNGANTGGDGNRTKDLSGTVRFYYDAKSFAGFSGYYGVNTGADLGALSLAIDLFMHHQINNALIEIEFAQSIVAGTVATGWAIDGIFPDVISPCTLVLGYATMDPNTLVANDQTVNIVGGLNVPIDADGKNLWMTNVTLSATGSAASNMIATQIRAFFD